MNVQRLLQGGVIGAVVGLAIGYFTPIDVWKNDAVLWVIGGIIVGLVALKFLRR